MTISLLARDPSSGQLGVATATHAYGVGPVADHARAGVGVAATQSFVEVSYGPRGLELMERGVSADKALASLLGEDVNRDIRQVAYVDATGGVAHHTGSQCVPCCGATVDGSAVAIGNMLDNDTVLASMLDGFRTGSGDLADRLLAGLVAGDRAGGDVRGRMSAAVRVVSGRAPRDSWAGDIVDLRVDFDPDPCRRLQENLKVHRAYGVFFECVFAPGVVTGPEPIVGEELEKALAGLAETQRVLGDDYEPTMWQGVLLVRADRLREGCRAMAEAMAARPAFVRFVDGLASVGTIPFGADEVMRRAGS